MSARENQIASTMVKAKGKTFFLDLKKASNNAKYLTICESRKRDGKFEKSYVMIFEDHFESFVRGLQEVLSKA